MLAYLVTGRNNRESIRLLSVHQNTLLYRLTKIRELFGIDFLDGKLSLTLLCNMLLLEVAQPDLLPLYKLDSPEDEFED
jgi:DNA-binding PucR family transcriptional regulator